MTKAIARLLTFGNTTAARTYKEFIKDDKYWREGQPLYTITNAQLQNIARELAGDDRKLYAKIYTTMHEGLRA
jgi:hypothetical protein